MMLNRRFGFMTFIGKMELRDTTEVDIIRKITGKTNVKTCKCQEL